MRNFITHKLTIIPVLAYLAFIILAYYGVFRFGFVSDNFVLSVIFLSLMTDGVILLLHLPRRIAEHGKVKFDPKKLTVLIACWNGEDVIGKTIEAAMKHVPASQIVVVDDNSTDRTVEIVEGYDARVVRNTTGKNLQKGLCISLGVKQVETEYVLVLDDDTLIDKTFIPTSLLDEGYAAVAFNVMPIPMAGNILNKMQSFEYRKSMQIGKNLRSSAGAVSNVSGAIGLYHTTDLVHQADRHSGQYGGEDQQRTLFTHLLSEKRGIIFYDSPVFTKAPATLKKWLFQRTLRWNSSTQEIFWLSWQIILSTRTHFLLKLNRAYYLFLLLTEPLRMFLLIIGLLTFSPVEILIIYLFYMLLDTMAWLKIGRKDQFWVVMLFPIYAKANMLCRQMAHFYWFVKKYEYFLRKKWHVHVPGRWLAMESVGVSIILIAIIWPLSINAFIIMLQHLRAVGV